MEANLMNIIIGSVIGGCIVGYMIGCKKTEFQHNRKFLRIGRNQFERLEGGGQRYGNMNNHARGRMDNIPQHQYKKNSNTIFIIILILFGLFLFYFLQNKDVQLETALPQEYNLPSSTNTNNNIPPVPDLAIEEVLTREEAEIETEEKAKNGIFTEETIIEEAENTAIHTLTKTEENTEKISPEIQEMREKYGLD